MEQKKIVIITGPTGSGKSDLALTLAQKFSGEIINADSRQVYKELNIGTAKPEIISVPHHLYDICTLDQTWSAGLFQKKADEAIAEISSRHHLPFIVGGTGLYIKVLLYGLFGGGEPDQDVRNKLKSRLDIEGVTALYAELQKVDPKTASKISPSDSVRILRALEVFYSTGKPFSIHQEAHSFSEKRYEFLQIGFKLERPVLYEKLNLRVDHMIEKGLEEEVKNLFDKYPDHPLLLATIGYKEWKNYFEKKVTLEETTNLIKQNTRNFAKRQETWFRKTKDIHWFLPSETEKISELVKNFWDD